MITVTIQLWADLYYKLIRQRIFTTEHYTLYLFTIYKTYYKDICSFFNKKQCHFMVYVAKLLFGNI